MIAAGNPRGKRGNRSHDKKPLTSVGVSTEQSCGRIRIHIFGKEMVYVSNSK